jgi:hypothetical protein
MIRRAGSLTAGLGLPAFLIYMEWQELFGEK